MSLTRTGPTVTILRAHVPKPLLTQFPIHMVRHLADWVAPSPCSQHSPPKHLKFLHTPP